MSEIFIDSRELSRLREFIELQTSLQAVFPIPARYVAVIDANIVIADLLHKFRSGSSGYTAIEECVLAGSLELHAGRKVLSGSLTALQKLMLEYGPILLEIFSEANCKKRIAQEHLVKINQSLEPDRGSTTQPTSSDDTRLKEGRYG